MRFPHHSPLARLGGAAVVVTAGCSNLTGIDRRTVDGVAYERRPSIVAQAGGAGPRVAAPDTVVAGQPFVVTVTTYASDCALPGETLRVTSGSTVEVRPFEWFVDEPRRDVPCDARPRLVSHTVAATLRTRGRAVLRVVGRQRGENAAVSLERAIVVR